MLIFTGKSAKYVIFPSKWLNMLFFKKLKKYVKKYVLCKSHKNPGPADNKSSKIAIKIHCSYPHREAPGRSFCSHCAACA